MAAIRPRLSRDDRLEVLRMSTGQWIGHYQKPVRSHIADHGKCVRKILRPGYLGHSDADIETAAGFHCVSGEAAYSETFGY